MFRAALQVRLLRRQVQRGAEVRDTASARTAFSGVFSPPFRVCFRVCFLPVSLSARDGSTLSDPPCMPISLVAIFTPSLFAPPAWSAERRPTATRPLRSAHTHTTARRTLWGAQRVSSSRRENGPKHLEFSESGPESPRITARVTARSLLPRAFAGLHPATHPKRWYAGGSDRVAPSL